MDEAFGVSRVGRVEDELAFFPHHSGLAVMHHGGGEQADAGMTVVVVVPGKEGGAESALSAREPKRPGNSGRYFMVRKWLSE